MRGQKPVYMSEFVICKEEANTEHVERGIETWDIASSYVIKPRPSTKEA